MPHETLHQSRPSLLGCIQCLFFKCCMPVLNISFARRCALCRNVCVYYCKANKPLRQWKSCGIRNRHQTSLVVLCVGRLDNDSFTLETKNLTHTRGGAKCIAECKGHLKATLLRYMTAFDENTADCNAKHWGIHFLWKVAVSLYFDGPLNKLSDDDSVWKSPLGFRGFSQWGYGSCTWRYRRKSAVCQIEMNGSE